MMVHRKKEESNHDLKEKRKTVFCPKCGWRLMDATSAVKTQLVIPTKGRYPDYFIKCGHCGAEIGVKKTE